MNNKTNNISRADIAQKEMLTRPEAAVYLGISLGYLHQLCANRLIPFYKPLGKKSYLKRSELDEWCARRDVRVKTIYELQAEAAKK